MDSGADGKKLTTPFMDISSKMVNLMPGYDERGLLGLAFHPDFKTNGQFYVFYTAPPRAEAPSPAHRGDNLTRISEFKVSASNATCCGYGFKKGDTGRRPPLF